MLKLGSLFDGSGGFPLAGTLCGIEPRWAAEVEPYPIAVTRSRFPRMKHLGDVSKVSGADIEPVDVITFGSPCQDLSVAGKRAGLKHTDNGDEETTRSGLFMEAVRIIREMREATNGKYPTFVLWENVPGAFSSNGGEDFRTVLAELIGIAQPDAVVPEIPRAGWAYADSWAGCGWSLAWRVFDAQYWGVPQRRRRIHLVVDFSGGRAQKVLFEREGVRGHTAQSGAEGQGAAEDAANRAGADDSDGRTGRMDSGAGGGSDQSGRVGVMWPAGTHGVAPQAVGFLRQLSGVEAQPHSGCRQTETARTLDCFDPSPAKNQGGIAVVQRRLMDAYQHHGYREGAVCGTLTANQNASVRGDTPLICQDSANIYCLQGNGIDRADTAECNGRGWTDNGTSYTLNTIDRPAVAFAMQAIGEYKPSDQASALKARDYKDATDLVCGVDCRNMTESPELYPTLQAKPNGGQSLNYSGAARIQYIVRRLTPTECARLQGFPDCWGHPDHKDSLTDEEYAFWCEVVLTKAMIDGKVVEGEDGYVYAATGKPYKHKTPDQMLRYYNGLHTDSAEYKMWGNGIALPPALYCMQGIAECLTERSE